MTIFTNRANELTRTIWNFLKNELGYSNREADAYVNAHFRVDGMNYGEQPRVHISDIAASDSRIVAVAQDAA